MSYIKNRLLLSKKIIPGGGTSLFSKIPENFLKEGWPSFYKKTRDVYVWDIENNKYLDFYFGVGQSTLGYNNPNVDAAVINAIKYGNMSTLSCAEESILAEKLLEINPWADMVKFARTGGEANAIAIRIARAKSKKDVVAVCGYHGWHDWYLSANINNSKNLNNLLMSGLNSKGVPNSLIKTVRTFKYNDIKSFYSAIKNEDVGVVKMEVIRNFSPTNDFLKKIRDICTKKKIILIFDECTTGFRETYGGIYSKFDVTPDMVVFGKALGNGYAITSIVGKGKIMSEANKTFISSTFWTERIGFAAAISTLNEMKRTQSWNKVINNGKKIKSIWEDLSNEFDIKIQINGIDSIPTLNFGLKKNNCYKSLISSEMLKNKILASNLVFTSALHDEKYTNIYKKNLRSIFEIISHYEGDIKAIKKYLKNNLCNSGFKRMN